MLARVHAQPIHRTEQDYFVSDRNIWQSGHIHQGQIHRDAAHDARIVFHDSRREITALVFAVCSSSGSSPSLRSVRRAASNPFNCSSTDGASSTSDEARCVESPSRTKWEACFSAVQTCGKSSAATPSRPMPVSTFK